MFECLLLAVRTAIEFDLYLLLLSNIMTGEPVGSGSGLSAECLSADALVFVSSYSFGHVSYVVSYEFEIDCYLKVKKNYEASHFK